MYLETRRELSRVVLILILSEGLTRMDQEFLPPSSGVVPYLSDSIVQCHSGSCVKSSSLHLDLPDYTPLRYLTQ